MAGATSKFRPAPADIHANFFKEKEEEEKKMVDGIWFLADVDACVQAREEETGGPEREKRGGEKEQQMERALPMAAASSPDGWGVLFSPRKKK